MGDEAEVADMDPTRPVIAVGESDVDSYWVLSGSGAPVPSVGIVSFEKTPACENG